MFPRIDYVDWVLPRIDEARHDLGSSDLHPEGPDGGVVPPRLADFETPDRTVRSLVADHYGVSTEEVLVTAGASSANLLAAATALERTPEGTDGTVLVEKPGYEPHVATPEGLGANVDRFVRPREDEFALSASRIGSALRPETALVTVSNRHNPSGRRVGRETLAECADSARENDTHLLVDEVYAPYGRATEDDGQAFGGPTAAGLPGTVVTGSLTKFFGLGPLRIGWLVAEPEFVERARATSVHLSDVARPSRLLARRALANAESFADAGHERCAHNTRRLREFVAEHDSLTATVHEGCPFAFVEHDSGDGDALAEAAEERDVLVVPGRFFGTPSGVRVALGRPSGQVDAALAAFGEAVEALDG